VKYDTIVWDFNGTLLNDAEFALGIINGLLQKRDLPTLSINRYKEIFTFPVIRFYQTAGFPVTKENFPIIAEEFISEFDKGLYKCPLQTDALETLSLFRKRNKKQLVLSAMEQNSLDYVIKQVDIRPFFDEICGVKDTLGYGKTEMGKTLFTNQKLDPKNAVLIGDTLHDSEVADQIGCDCILVATGHQSQQVLKKSQKKVFSSLKEVQSYI